MDIFKLYHELVEPTRLIGRQSHSTGWVKVNFAGIKTITISTLPADPTNNATYHYSYYSDGNAFEINAALESQQYQSKMVNDGGDNNNLYEVGSSLILLH